MAANPYGMTDIVNMLSGLKNSGQNEQAFKMFNSLSGNGQGGALSSALRQAWGSDQAKNWITAGDRDYRSFGLGDASKTAIINGWDPTRYNANYGSDFMREWAGAGGAGGDTGAMDSWIKNWAGGVGGTGYSPSGALAAENAAFQQSHGMDAQGNVIGPGQNNGNPYVAGAVPGGAAVMQPGEAGYKGPGSTAFTPSPALPPAPGTSAGGFAKPAAVSPVDAARAGYPTSAAGNPYTAPTPAATPAAPVTPAAPTTTPYTAPTREAFTKTPFDFLNDAGLKFRLGQGVDKIQQSAAAGGGLQSGQTLKDLEEFRQGVSSEEYGKAYDRYADARDFGEDQFQGDRSFGRGAYEDDRNYGRSSYESDRGFGEDTRRYNQGYARSLDRDARSDFQNDRDTQIDIDRYNSDTDYRRSVDAYNRETDEARWNKNFDYTARTGDRTFNQTTLTELSRLGQQAAGGDAAAQSAFMSALMKSIMGSADAGAQGGMGNQQDFQELLMSIFGQKKT